MAQHATTVRIRQFIIDNVAEHPNDIAAITASHFGISRQAVGRHLAAMQKSGALEAQGLTRARCYSLKEISRVDFELPILGLKEHVPWEDRIRPMLKDVPKNALDICAYGFMEMLNNAIDHSGSESVRIECAVTAECVDLRIVDDGVGIFRKIKEALNLEHEIEAVAELAKGKLTTDPKRHTGEGIFFTSRAFDYFAILSGQLYFSHTRPDNDWIIEDRENPFTGTYVRMTVSLKTPTVLKKVFDQFTTEGEYDFSKTHVPVSLLQHGTDNLVSRSQARRLLSRFEMFREVLLDFEGVESIGQAFADEVFRVYQAAHPEVKLIPIGANPDVAAMISRALRAKPDR
jgi:anti-sigma regulatory factor (Ser/Thr protein kinase)